MSNRLKCCCGTAGCECSTFSFDFETYAQTGVGGTHRSTQKRSNVCSMLPELDNEGTGVQRIVGDVTFICTTLNGWQFSSGNAQYDPNMDMNGATGYQWIRPPTYTLGRCSDVGCLACDADILDDWLVQNDNSSVSTGSVATYVTLPTALQTCFPSLPSTPTNGLYRVVQLILYGEADRASRRTQTNTSYNGGSCPADSTTTGSYSAITPFYIYVGFIWDTSSICTEGNLVGTFRWNPKTGNCSDAFPYDNDSCTSSTTAYYCSASPSDLTCCVGPSGTSYNTFDQTIEACFFDSAGADASNWSTT
jgi:hypothetical protein